MWSCTLPSCLVENDREPYMSALWPRRLADWSMTPWQRRRQPSRCSRTPALPRSIALLWSCSAAAGPFHWRWWRCSSLPELACPMSGWARHYCRRRWRSHSLDRTALKDRKVNLAELLPCLSGQPFFYPIYLSPCWWMVKWTDSCRHSRWQWHCIFCHRVETWFYSCWPYC